MVLVVPFKWLRKLEKDKLITLSDFVAITSRYVGEYERPVSIVVDTDKLDGKGNKLSQSLVKLLVDSKCKEE